jgi:hypothetical protein
MSFLSKMDAKLEIDRRRIYTMQNCRLNTNNYRVLEIYHLDIPDGDTTKRNYSV